VVGVPRFYTLPPAEVPYPFVLVNAHRPEPGLAYLERHRGIVESVIIDSGVEVFRDPRVKDYPGGYAGWVERLVGLYDRVRALVRGGEVYVTAPDYPDDYHPRGLWVGGKTNVERTIESILYAIREHPGVPWLIPVQGHYEDPKSIVGSLEKYEEAGILGWAASRTRYIAIANLCVSRRCATIRETLRLASTWLAMHGYQAGKRSLRCHVFGPAANCVRQARLYLDSWDSTAWTRPRAPGGWSAKTSSERVYLFLSFIHKYADLIELPPKPATMGR
jgi:hypothetical protein